jgi:hypothetical protein
MVAILLWQGHFPYHTCKAEHTLSFRYRVVSWLRKEAGTREVVKEWGLNIPLKVRRQGIALDRRSDLEISHRLLEIGFVVMRITDVAERYMCFGGLISDDKHVSMHFSFFAPTETGFPPEQEIFIHRPKIFALVCPRRVENG